ncbi:DNA mismatch repair protein MutL [Candidatus Karelsulcia muelleri]|uniref:DNA mismatch repair protein MutL n=1 Tax=Candidatus Karelsulcia muelleri TaxID=336810 RepID=A0A346E0Y4_9FLAO|nr:DNA mismatch repair protein MutL [Candidatus Karelsulcia muelleri]
MKNKLQILPHQDAKKISAGYVIKRPSAVVKELLENSIDAKAKNIQLILSNGGKDLIHVIDDGEGMNPSEAKNSISRFYTSKIESLKDIKYINTKGFRGEALYYISLVSNIEIYTKRKNSELGVFLTLANNKRKFKTVLLKNLVNGTSIYVKNLFYNFPNRKKFLKSSTIELRYIISEVHKIVLSHPYTNFLILHNNKRITRFKKSDIKSRIIEIFGDYYQNVLIKVMKKEKLFLIKGYITSTSFFNTKVNNSYLFVNNRYVVNKRIHTAIISAYNGIISKSNKPNYFLFINIPQPKIEINICQSKTKILIKSEAEICKKINIIIKESLGLKDVFKCWNSNKSNYSKENTLKEVIKKIDFQKVPYKIYKTKYILCLLDFGILIINKTLASNIILDYNFKKEIKTNKRLDHPIKLESFTDFTIYKKDKQDEQRRQAGIIEIFKHFGFQIKGFEITYAPKFLKRIYLCRLLYDLYLSLSKLDYKNEKQISELISQKLYHYYKLEFTKNIAFLEISKLITKIVKLEKVRYKLYNKIFYFLDIKKIFLKYVYKPDSV